MSYMNRLFSRNDASSSSSLSQNQIQAEADRQANLLGNIRTVKSYGALSVPDEKKPFLSPSEYPRIEEEESESYWSWYHAFFCSENAKWHFLLCWMTILNVIVFGVYGLWQERIMVHPYDTNSTPECENNPGACLFRWSILLVTLTRFMAAGYSILMMWWMGQQMGPQVSIWKYCLVSTSNVLSTSCQYESLKYISFPMQMLAKSVKMVPVMVWGVCAHQKRYKIIDWFVAFGVAFGTAGFALFGNVTMNPAHPTVANGKSSSFSSLIETMNTKSHPLIDYVPSYDVKNAIPDAARASIQTSDGPTGDLDPFHLAVGIGLMFVYLIADGFTSTFQEQLFEKGKTTKHNQMFYINMISGVFGIATLVFSDSWIASYHFIKKHPLFLWDATTLSVSATVGQIAVISCIQYFGALVTAAIMTLRQVVSTLLSLLYYGHPVNAMQIICLIVCLMCLCSKQILNFTRHGMQKTNPNHMESDTTATDLPLTREQRDHVVAVLSQPPTQVSDKPPSFFSSPPKSRNHSE
eukprot:gene366-686_t